MDYNKKIVDVFASFIKDSGSLVQSSDSEGKIVYTNPAWQKALGYSGEEIKKLKFTDILRKDQATYYEDILNTLCPEKKNIYVDTVFIAKNGKEIFVSGSLGAYFQDSQLVSIQGIFNDVSNRKKEEELLKLTQYVVDTSNEEIFWVHHDARFYYVNKEACRALGYSQEELLQKTVYDIDPGFDEARFMNSWNKAVTDKKFSTESIQKRKNGKTFPVDLDVNYVVFNNNEFLVVFAKNITERKQAEEQIKLFKTFSQASTQGLGWTDMSGIIQYANPALCRMYGGEDQEKLTGRPVFQFYEPEDVKRLKEEIFPEVIAKGSWTGELPLKNQQGEKMLTLNNIFIIRNERGEPLYLSNLIVDIKEMKKTEELLKHSEILHRAIFENTGTAMIIIEENKIISRCNQQFIEMTGYSRDEIENKIMWSDIVHHDDVGRMIEQHKLRRINPEKAMRQYEFRLVTKNRQERDAIITVAMIPETKKSIASMMDISDRKRIEEQVIHEKEKIEKMINSSNDFIFTLDTNTVILEANKYFETKLGYKIQDVIGKNAIDLFIDKSEVPKVKDALQQLLIDGKASVEVSVLRKNGEKVLSQMNGVLIKDENGKPQEIFIISRDITDIKKNENEIKRRNEELEKFSQIAVDRELRMIELKKKIQELESKIKPE